MIKAILFTSLFFISPAITYASDSVFHWEFNRDMDKIELKFAQENLEKAKEVLAWARAKLEDVNTRNIKFFREKISDKLTDIHQLEKDITRYKANIAEYEKWIHDAKLSTKIKTKLTTVFSKLQKIPKLPISGMGGPVTGAVVTAGTVVCTETDVCEDAYNTYSEESARYVRHIKQDTLIPSQNTVPGFLTAKPDKIEATQ